MGDLWDSIWGTVSGQAWLTASVSLVAAGIAWLGYRSANRWDARLRKAATEELDLASRLKDQTSPDDIDSILLIQLLKSSAKRRARKALSPALRRMTIAYATLLALFLPVFAVFLTRGRVNLLERFRVDEENAADLLAAFAAVAIILALLWRREELKTSTPNVSIVRDPEEQAENDPKYRAQQPSFRENLWNARRWWRNFLAQRDVNVAETTARQQRAEEGRTERIRKRREEERELTRVLREERATRKAERRAERQPDRDAPNSAE